MAQHSTLSTLHQVVEACLEATGTEETKYINTHKTHQLKAKVTVVTTGMAIQTYQITAGILAHQVQAGEHPAAQTFRATLCQSPVDI